MNPIVGSIVALVTPMREDGSIDHDALRALIDWHIAEGTDCIGVVGTTGESPTITVDEHWEVIRVAVEHARGRIPVMAGTGANSTAEAIEHSRYAAKVGADCALSVVPYYNKPSQEGIYPSRCSVSSRLSPGSTNPARALHIGTLNRVERARRICRPLVTRTMIAGERRG